MGKKSQGGQTLVEFAAILPILLLLFLGIVGFGAFLYDQAVITNASREGARVGIVNQDRSNLATINATITNAVNNYCSGLLLSGSGPAKATPDWSGGTSFGSPLKVTVTFNYTWLGLRNFIPGLGKQTQMTAVTVMILE